MNLSELQAFLEDSSWNDEPEPAQPTGGLFVKKPSAYGTPTKVTAKEIAVEDVASEQVFATKPPLRENLIPTLIPEPNLQNSALNSPVKLVPRVKEDPSHAEPELRATDSVRERLMEVEMAQKMGYLLCKCTWPPQIMVLIGTDHVYRCRRCSRVREM